MSVRSSQVSTALATLLLVPHSLPDPDMPAWPAMAFQVLGDLVEQVPGLTVAVFERQSDLRRAELALAGLVEVSRLAEPVQPVLSRTSGVLLTTREFAVRHPGLLASARTLVISRLALPWPRPPWVPEPPGEDPCRFLHHDLPRAVEAFRSLVEPILAAGQGLPRLLVVLDPRLVNRPYGRWFLQALPGLSRCRELDEALAHLSTQPAVMP